MVVLCLGMLLTFLATAAGCGTLGTGDGEPSRADSSSVSPDGGPTKAPRLDVRASQDSRAPLAEDSGYRLSKNADFSTDDVVFSAAGALYVQAWNFAFDGSPLKTQEVEVSVGGTSVKQPLLYEKGFFHAAIKLSGLALVDGGVEGVVQGELADYGSNQWSFSEEITLTE